MTDPQTESHPRERGIDDLEQELEATRAKLRHAVAELRAVKEVLRSSSAESLRESEARFRTLADNIAQLAWMADGQGWIFWYNKRWYDYTGTTHAEVEGWGWRKVHHPDHIDRVVEKVSHCFQTGESWEDTFPLRGADGRYRWFLSRALPIRDAHGAVVRWFGTNTDVTEQRETEQRLVQADRQKDEFIAMLGHELRNPLAALRSAAELLRASTSSDPILAQARDVLDRQTAHMARLLDGLLDVSRIMRGKIAIKRVAVDLVDVCRVAAADLRERLGERQLGTRIELPPAPVWVEGDRVRLVQILDNLLTNAAKFTPDGGSISLVLAPEGETAVLRVRDTGCGIDPDQVPLVFTPFWQSEQTLDRSGGGLGLGLALVKSLTELHGGRVEVGSAGRDRGAEFAVRLPLTAPPDRAGEPTTARRRTPLRLLLIEDNPDAAQMLQSLLQGCGHEVRRAADGREGIALARALKPDAIFCDLGLPGGMSGYDVAETLRRDGALGNIRLVAVSGYGRPEDKQRALAAGFDAHMTKPMTINQLEDLLARLRGS